MEGGQINPKWLTAVKLFRRRLFLASNVIRMCFHRKVNMTVLLGRSLTASYWMRRNTVSFLSLVPVVEQGELLHGNPQFTFPPYSATKE